FSSVCCRCDGRRCTIEYQSGHNPNALCRVEQKRVKSIDVNSCLKGTMAAMSVASSELPRKAVQSSALAAELLLRAEKPETVAAYLADALPALLPALAADFAAVTASGFGLRAVAEAGLRQTWPAELVSECLDREEVQISGAWLAAPLAARETSGEVLVMHR